MKAWTISLLAVFVIAFSFGCSKDDSNVDSALDDAKDKAESAAESVKDAVEDAEGQVEGAKESIEDAVANLGAFKDEMSGKVGELEGKLDWMKQMSGTLKNEELSGMVSNLDGKLSDCKSKLTGMENLSADKLVEQKAALTSEVTELAGMFNKTESMIDELRKKIN